MIDPLMLQDLFLPFLTGKDQDLPVLPRQPLQCIFQTAFIIKSEGII